MVVFSAILVAHVAVKIKLLLFLKRDTRIMLSRLVIPKSKSSLENSYVVTHKRVITNSDNSQGFLFGR